jgi:hypothetical protein
LLFKRKQDQNGLTHAIHGVRLTGRLRAFAFAIPQTRPDCGCAASGMTAKEKATRCAAFVAYLRKQAIGQAA